MWFLFFAVLSLDRIAKYYFSKQLILNQSLPVVKNIFHLTLVHNTGAAFGIFKGQTYFFIIISLLAIFLIYRYLRLKQGSSMILRVALTLMLSGTLGNLVDRIKFGYVVDFLDFRIWPVFNIADSSITIGAILLAFTLLRRPSHASGTI